MFMQAHAIIPGALNVQFLIHCIHLHWCCMVALSMIGSSHLIFHQVEPGNTQSMNHSSEIEDYPLTTVTTNTF